jgi:capsular exopolysaccharide synthesis family protein
MNNEIQLSSMGGLPAYPMPGMGGGLGGFNGQPSTPDDGAVRKLHRLLRGRYLLACVLGLLGAAAGAVAGYLSQKPAYRAEGQIVFNPVKIDSESERVMPMFQAYVTSQMAQLLSDDLIRKAMQSPKYQAVRMGKVDDAAIAEFKDKLIVQPAPKANTTIMLAFTDNGPGSQDICSAAVASLIEVYREDRQRTDDPSRPAGPSASDPFRVDTVRLEAARAELQKVEARITAKIAQINDKAAISDGDTEMVRQLQAALTQRKQDLAGIREMLAVAKEAVANADRQDPPAPEDWGRVDSSMAAKLKVRDELRLIAKGLSAQLGANHPAVQSREREVRTTEADIEEYAATLRSKYVIRWHADGNGSLLVKDTRILENQLERLTAQFDADSKSLREIRQTATEISMLRTELNNDQAVRATLNNRISELEFRRDNQAKVSYIANKAKPDKDRRPIFAAVGFMGGAGIPIGLLLLFGLFDTRYRFSDEASVGGTGIGGLTLLGILPNLPDRLSDPEQAAIAAHCVHQIRTMLQINTGLEDRRVFSVTSASPGDGKTSLTLALGLSYAACGTRTLLIDCDLIGSGLSSRMNVNAPEGVLEAIANRSLLPFVKQTDVADVSILPVGTAGNLHASTLSPQALRRLIEEAEQHFEVILIDTGPILGSIEASLVCAAADAVILTVARGQQRPMVEKSLGHLAAIGAKLAGVVFNRAQAQDFERSISGVSMRSVGVPGLPRGARSSGPRFGPVARAVQGQTTEIDSTEEPPHE